MKKIGFILVYFLSPIVLMTVLFQGNTLKYQNDQLLFAMVFGALGYTWFVWQFILSARLKFIEAVFGMDKIYRFHGVMATVSIIVAFVHRTINEEIFGESFTTTLGTIGLFTFIVITVVTLIFMATPIKLQKLPGIKWIKNKALTLKIFKYEILRILHNVTFIALVFMYLHVINTSGVKTNKLAFGVYTVYFIVAVLCYLYHKVYKGFMLSDKQFTVSNVVQESPNMWSVEFVPANGQKINHKPGQFGFFSFKSQGIGAEEHPFTISSGNIAHKMSITVKELGDYTHLIKKIHRGDRVKVDAPYGQFSYLNFPKEKESVFIAGGVGITPMISMLRYMNVVEPNRKVTLLWGMNTLKDYIVKDEIGEMILTMSDLKVIPIISKDKEYHGEIGYIDFDRLQRLLSEQLSNASTVGFYVCGPPIMMDKVVSDLKKLGVSRDNIHFEQFSL